MRKMMRVMMIVMMMVMVRSRVVKIPKCLSVVALLKGYRTIDNNMSIVASGLLEWVSLICGVLIFSFLVFANTSLQLYVSLF